LHSRAQFEPSPELVLPSTARRWYGGPVRRPSRTGPPQHRAAV